MAQILNSFREEFRVFLEGPDPNVAVEAQQGANPPICMPVVNVELGEMSAPGSLGGLAADGAASILGQEHGFVLLDRDPVEVPQVSIAKHSFPGGFRPSFDDLHIGDNFRVRDGYWGTAFFHGFKRAARFVKFKLGFAEQFAAVWAWTQNPSSWSTLSRKRRAVAGPWRMSASPFSISGDSTCLARMGVPARSSGAVGKSFDRLNLPAGRADALTCRKNRRQSALQEMFLQKLNWNELVAEVTGDGFGFCRFSPYPVWIGRRRRGEGRSRFVYFSRALRAFRQMLPQFRAFEVLAAPSAWDHDGGPSASTFGLFSFHAYTINKKLAEVNDCVSH